MFDLFMIALFASFALLTTRIRCAVFWFGFLLSIDFAHLIILIPSGSMSLASHISMQWFSSLGSMASETLSAIMLKVLVWNWVFLPIFPQIFFWLSVFVVHVADASESILIVVFPFLVLVSDRIFPVLRPISYKILFSSALSFNVSRCANFDCLMPSIKNCLAFMPSLAAILGLACASGLISADAYVFVVWQCWVSGVGVIIVAEVTIFLSWSSDI